MLKTTSDKKTVFSYSTYNCESFVRNTEMKAEKSPTDN